jgi:hypothetical protein
VRLVFEHWELSRQNMEMFVAPKELKNDALARISNAPSWQVA